MRTTLRRISLSGFKSIRSAEVSLGNLNVLIGANGAGKSNFISFFKLLNEMMAGRMQEHIAVSGRAQSMLYFGLKETQQITVRLEFDAEKGKNAYDARLFLAPGDSLFFAEENLCFAPEGNRPPKLVKLGTGHQETRIGEFAEKDNKVAKTLLHFLNRSRVFHFHDTSPTARIRSQYCYTGDNRWLMHDAGNLAAILYRLRHEENNNAYKQIVRTIRLIAPFFDDFDLEPSGVANKEIILNWRQKGSDQIFGPHQFSDGTLRAICLISLLLQPVDEMPVIIIIDEPELGLHPYALGVIAALCKKASFYTQLLISTQSTSFLNHFDPEDIIITNRSLKETSFERPDPEMLNAWLEEYSFGEVWEKNIIGGGPF
jgi:predicted ATPase